MESIHYKILDVLVNHPNSKMNYSELKKSFPTISDLAFRELLSTEMQNMIDHSVAPDENGDFLIAINSSGEAAYYTQKYSNFINTKTLRKNRAISFLLGILTTLITGAITEIITSGLLSQLLHQLIP